MGKIKREDKQQNSCERILIVTDHQSCHYPDKDGNMVNNIFLRSVTIDSQIFDLNKCLKLLKTPKPIIVLDPGHGYSKGNTGASASIYKYKVRDSPSLTREADVDNLPDYVLDDPDKWIASKKEDHKKAEAYLVYDVSVRLKDLLEKEGYKVLMTRDQRGGINGADNGETRKKRIDLANDNKADYYVSIHADGDEKNTLTGSHVIYPNENRQDADICAKSRELGLDIMKYYTVVKVESESPKVDIRGLQVLGSTNKTQRQVLIELGFVSTPKEARKLFSSVNEIADQLKRGLIEHISSKFYS